MVSSRIIGTGSYLPSRVVTNEEVAGPLGIAADDIQTLTGIRERRWAAPDEAASDMALEAGRRALEATGCEAGSLDAIIVSTTSPDRAFPSTACYVQRGLGCRGVGAFDVSASCSGFLYALSMANAMVMSGQVQTCLVAASEVKSRFLDATDESTAMLFGDGAGAVVLRGETTSHPVKSGILGLRLHADGAGHRLIRVEAGGSRMPSCADTVAEGRHVLRMKGASVFRVAVRRIEQAVHDILKEFGIPLDEVKQVVLHQANGRILAQVADRLNLPRTRVASVLERFGNTSSASLPIALDSAARAGTLASGDVVLLGAFGGGLTWATGLMRW
ncbi:MAG: ketoacyl-ACP synthase III [Nitrospiraceae bacterium]|nr:ketoacyl-ACP synthase III [Nitrospiraceae bacterium]